MKELHIVTENQPEISDDESILIYPNPACETIFIEGLTPGCGISIHSIEGRLLCFSEPSGRTKQKVSLQTFTPGIYFVSITGQNQKITRKIVVK